jgi:hypothetical protein
LQSIYEILIGSPFPKLHIKPSTKYLREERSSPSRLERPDEMRVHEQDATWFIIDLGKKIPSS